MPGDDPGGVVDRGSFGEALTRLRAARGLSLRVLARRTGLPVSTLGDWSKGTTLPQRGQVGAFREVLTACEVPTAEQDAWVNALERARVNPPRRDVAPYRGLLPYEAADSAWFFGRERLTARVVERVAAVVGAGGPRVVAVVGPSGSGKSSVLRAGVVPAVAVEGVPGSDLPWAAEVMTPGDDPLGAFAARPSAAVAPSADPSSETAPLAALLVVDQFEELFAAAVDDDVRTRFLDAVFALAGSPASRTVVALGLRADFYGVAVADPRLARVLQDEQVVVAPMGEAELRAAVVEPARRAEVEVDPELVERLLREMGVTRAGGTHDAGALPLLSHALRATWERSTGRRLTTADYEATGGLAGAVEQTAEDVHRGLEPAGREVARRLFTRLVRLDEATGTLTRRTLARDALPGTDPATTAAVVDAFVERRLLTAGDGTVTISHERLLTAWPRLGEWLEADRDALRTHEQLADAVRDWQASGRDPSYLLTGTRLAAAAELAADDGTALTPVERELLAASVDAGDADRRRQRRRLQRTRQLLALVVVLLLATSTAGILAARSRSAAEDARRQAEEVGRAALSPLVAVNARQLQARDPALAQQLAAVAWRTAPSPEARSALLDLAEPGVVTRVLGGDGPTTLALAPDGRTLAVGHGDDGSVHLFTLRSGAAPAPLAVIPGSERSQVFALAWHGNVLAVGGTTGVVSLWAVEAGRAVRRASLDHPFERAVEGVAFAPDGRSLAAVSDGDQPVRVWDVTDATAPRWVGAPAGVPAGTTEQAVTFSPDGTRLLTAGTGGTLFAWPTAGLSTAAPTVVPSTSGATVYVLRYDPAGRGLYLGDRDGVVTVRDPGSLATTATHDLSSTAWVNTLAFSPDGSEVAVGTSDGAVDRIAADAWTLRSTTGNPGPVTGLVYAPDGSSLVSAAADGTTRVTPTGGVTVGDGLNVFSVAFPGTGDTVAVATSGSGATTQLWSATGDGGSRARGAAWQVPDLTGTAAARPDGQVLATGSRDGTVRLWDVRDPARPVQLGAAFAGATAPVEILAFSPDGRTLAVGSDDNTLRLWDVSRPVAPRALGVLPAGNYVVGAAFSPDGRRVAAASVDNSAYLWDVTAPATPVLQAKLDGFGNYVWGVAFSPDGRLLAAASADRTTRLWDVGGATPRLLTVLSGPKGYEIAAAFSPDSRTLAVASHDAGVWLYDVGTPSAPRTLATLTAVGGVVNAVSFSPDGKHLVAGGRSTTVPVWDTDPEAVVARICAAGGDRITRQEWSDYVPGAAYDPPCG